MKRVLFLFFIICLVVPAAAAESSERIGTVFDLLSRDCAGYSETALGDAAADAMAFQTDADLAILPAGALQGNLRGGQVSREEIYHAVDGGMELAVAQVTPAQLYSLLEYGLAELTVDDTECLDTDASSSEWFPQISGFDLWIDASAPVGERVYELRIDGNVVKRDGEGTFTLCTSFTWLCQMGIPGTAIDASPASALEAYIAAGQLEDSVTQGRIRILGTLDDNFMNSLPPFVILIVFAVVVVSAVGFVRYNGRPASKRYGTR